MSRIFNELKANYSQIPNELINDDQLSHQARFLFVLLASQKDDFKLYQNWILKKMNWKDAKTLTKYWSELQGNGWGARVRKRKESGKWGLYDYHLFASKDLDKVVKLTRWEKTPGGEKSSMDKTPPLNKTNLNNKTNITKQDEGASEKFLTSTPPTDEWKNADTIPYNEYSTAKMNDFLSAGELCYQNIFSRIQKYFAERERGSTFCESISCKMTTNEWNKEISAWIRHNMTRQEFYANPTKFLRGGKGNLVSWLQKDWKPYFRGASAYIEKQAKQKQEIFVNGYDSPIMREKRARIEKALKQANK